MSAIASMLTAQPPPVRYSFDSGVMTLTQITDGFTRHVRACEGEAVVLAWRILNDLRPADVDQVLAEENEQRRDLIRERMLAMLAISDCTSAQLASVLGPEPRELSGIIKPLTMTDHIKRIDGGGPRDRATWAITDKGRALVLSRQPTHGGRTAA